MGAGDIEDRETLKAWLDSQPRQVVNLIAARVALRTLPLFSRAARTLDSLEFGSRENAPRRFADWTGALFRAIALARVAGTYPTRSNELHAAAAAAADAAAAAAADAAAAAYAAADAAAYAADAVAAAAYAADAAAAYAAAAAAYAAAAAAAVWASVRADALAIEGDGIHALLRSRLWIMPPDWIIRASEALRDTLPKNANWDVWHKWYDDRLNGVVYDEPRDFVFAAVPTEVWDQGSAAANSWIRAELDNLDDRKAEGDKPEALSGAQASPKPRRQTLANRLKSLDEQPSPVELVVSPAGKIAEVEQWPAIIATPSPRGADDRVKLQDLCRKAASDLANDVAKGLFSKFRDPYLVLTLERYAEYVPSSNFAGNILRADYQAKLLSRLRAPAQGDLPPRVADPLELLLGEHRLLRVFYLAPAASDAFIEQVGDAPPPSPERLAEIPEALDRDASDAFEPGAKEAIKESLQSDPPAPSGASSEETRNIEGARAYLILTTLNRLVKVLDVGSKANGAINLARQILEPIIERLLNDWLPHWPNWPW